MIELTVLHLLDLCTRVESAHGGKMTHYLIDEHLLNCTRQWDMNVLGMT